MANDKRISFLQDPTVFSDLRDLEAAERRRLEDRRRLLKEISMPQKDGSPRKRFLTPEETSELEEIEKKLATDDVVDPMFKAVQLGLSQSLDVKDHKEGLFPSQQWIEAIHNMFANGQAIDWKSFAGLAQLEEEVDLIDELKKFWANEEARKKLPLVAEVFDNVVARLHGKLSKRELKQLSTQILAINDDSFFAELVEVVNKGRVFEAESLVDWLIAASPTPSGRIGIQPAFIQSNPHDLTAEEKNVAAVIGLLSADREEPPRYRLGSTQIFDPVEARRRQEFGRALFAAHGEYSTNRALFDAVLPVLVNAGSQGPLDEVAAIEWARVVRYLTRRGVNAAEPQLVRRVNEALNSTQNVGDDIPPSDISIDLPDLESDGTTDHEIVEDNIRALQPAYFAAMFEELKVFQVVDKLVELFQNGILPIGKGEAGDSLFKYWKESATRVSESERRSFYARTLGFVGGDDGLLSPNREFNDLWMRFVSAVSNFIRQNSVDDLLRTKIPGAISQQQVRKAGRDLAANLSLHGYGMAHFMATELQKQIKDVIKVLSDPDIKNSYGARDMWQVIDQVAALELGGSRNSVRYRTMAAASAIILGWLAKRARQLSSTSFGPILDMDQIRNPPPRPAGTKASTDPTDFDLVNACEQWLAVTGTQEELVMDYSQPKEAPNMTSKPIQIPAIARETLEAFGVPAMSYGGNGNRR